MTYHYPDTGWSSAVCCEIDWYAVGCEIDWYAVDWGIDCTIPWAKIILVNL